MRSSKPSSPGSTGNSDERLSLLGGVLRRLYRHAVRPVDTPPVVTAAPRREPSTSFDEAQGRVRKAAQSLDLVAALTLNPLDPTALDQGIEMAMRRLEEDLH